MKYKILTVIIIILVFLATFAAACGQDDKQAIRDSMTGFLTAYNNQEYGRCLEYISDDLRANRGDGNLVVDLEQGRASSGTANLESIGKPDIDGENAIISVSFNGFMGQVTRVQFPLIKESGSWKINA